MRVHWEDLNGSYLSYSNAQVGSAAGGLPASFTEKGGTVTAPTGAVFGSVEVYFYLASGWLNVDDVSVTPTSTVNISETLYYSFGGDTVGMRVDGELSWIFADQLGSTGITYQADGSATTRQFYYPFGGIRSPGGAPVVDTDVGFTGQRLDETTGLMFYQARYYDPLTARFISADTIVPDPGNPQDFNRYSYVRNNPLGYTDPTGNEPDDTYACPGSLYECTKDVPTYSAVLWDEYMQNFHAMRDFENRTVVSQGDESALVTQDEVLAMLFGAIEEAGAGSTKNQLWIWQRQVSVQLAMFSDDGALLALGTGRGVMTTVSNRTVFAIDISALPRALQDRVSASMVARLGNVASKGTIVLAMVWDPGAYSDALATNGWVGVVAEGARRYAGWKAAAWAGGAAMGGCTASTLGIGFAGCLGISVGSGFVAYRVTDWAVTRLPGPWSNRP